MNLDLKGKNAIVCGGTAGIGNAAAIELAKLGACVTLVARNQTKLEAAVAELPALQGQHHDFIVADFSNPDTVKTRVQAYLLNGKTCHVLVNNTGGPPGGPIRDAKPAEFLAALNQHLICNHVLVQAVLPGMKEAGYGRIINVISTSVKAPLDNLGVSNTTRGAVANWAKTLANELGIYGITVNNVLPGATETGRLKSIIANKAKKLNKTEVEVSDAMKKIIPAKRFAHPEEVAYAIAFLATRAASYINGINLPVDGGRTRNL